MHILTFLFFSLNLSSSFLDPFFPLVEMLSEPENTHTQKKKKQLFYFILFPKRSITSLAQKKNMKQKRNCFVRITLVNY